MVMDFCGRVLHSTTPLALARTHMPLAHTAYTYIHTRTQTHTWTLFPLPSAVYQTSDALHSPQSGVPDVLCSSLSPDI